MSTLDTLRSLEEAATKEHGYFGTLDASAVAAYHSALCNAAPAILELLEAVERDHSVDGHSENEDGTCADSRVCAALAKLDSK